METGAIIRVDTSTPAGRRFVRDFEKTRTRARDKAVQIEYPQPPEIAGQKWSTHKEVWSKFEKKFNEHYNTDVKFV